jgi:hypothetical protein
MKRGIRDWGLGIGSVRQRRRRDRAGYALVLFVMLFFGLMGLAALVIDMGFARLAQREMQTAVDSAALEGLRWRDVQQSENLPPAWLASPDFQQQTGVSPGTGTLSSQQRDAVRRWATSNMVANVFADYVDSGGTVQNGAGPVVNFSGGVPGAPAEWAAGQTITWPPPPPYQPARSSGTAGLELNLSNGTEGDMSSGTYGLNPGYDPTQLADEDTSYDRRNFMPSQGTADSASAPAFLVRMRRTNNPGGLDQEPGISCGGPTLPVLFGRGSMMARSGDSGQLSVESGITVRATAIAAVGQVNGLTSSGTPYSVGRAKTVGPALVVSGGTIAGHGPFALRSDIWAGLAVSGGTLTPTGGTLMVAGELGDPVPEGLVLPGTATGLTLSATGVSSIGQPVEPAADASPLDQYPPNGAAVYVPIYTSYQLGGQPYTVIGFGLIAVANWNSSQVVISPIAQQPSNPVASQNASGVVGLAVLASFSPQDVTTLFQLHEGTESGSGLSSQNMTHPLYAPVLANHTIGPNQTNP